ncbi:MAG: hypothetical protein FWE59_03450 [Oscillospiraceae bacterium]|nr:hypothetical protein [Oscillospiraceae bacterium]
MALLLETRFRVPDENTTSRILSSPRILAILQESWRKGDILSSYFDTPKHALNLLHWELRFRREGLQGALSLKTPKDEAPAEQTWTGQAWAGLSCYDKWQCPAEGAREGVPRLVGMGAPAALPVLVLQGDLIELCQVSCQRLSGVLELSDGAAATLAIDRGELLAGEKREPFIEMTIELLYGDPSVAGKLAENLAVEYGLTRVRAGKYDRALRLVRSRPATSAPATSAPTSSAPASGGTTSGGPPPSGPSPSP